MFQTHNIWPSFTPCSPFLTPPSLRGAGQEDSRAALIKLVFLGVGEATGKCRFGVIHSGNWEGSKTPTIPPKGFPQNKSFIRSPFHFRALPFLRHWVLKARKVRKTKRRGRHGEANTHDQTRTVTHSDRHGFPKHSVLLACYMGGSYYLLTSQTQRFPLNKTVHTMLIKLNAREYQVFGHHRGSTTVPFPTRVKSQPP